MFSFQRAVLGYEVIHQITASLAGISCNCHTLLSSKNKFILSISFIALRGCHGSKQQQNVQQNQHNLIVYAFPKHDDHQIATKNYKQ